jgi:hypothetical protein
MEIVFISAGVFGLFFTMMAVGVLFGRKPISGSCGGVGAAGVGGACSTCGKAAAGECDTPGMTADGKPVERTTIFSSIMR